MASIKSLRKRLISLCHIHGYDLNYEAGMYEVTAPKGCLVGRTDFHQTFVDIDDLPDGEESPAQALQGLVDDVSFPPGRCDDPACQTCGRIAEPEVEFLDDQADGRTVNSDLAW